jgi:multidrug efflux pump subunit AcrA (membrane-fusion protein)
VLQPTTSLCWRGAILGALVALFSLTPVPAQEVYRSVDAAGHVVYSDRGATKNAPKTAVRVEEGDPAEAARLAKEQQLLQAEETQRTKQQAIDDKNKANADHQKQVACQNARNYYYRLRDSGRIYQRDSDGNRVYYSDSEADTLREQAKRAMTSACGT